MGAVVSKISYFDIYLNIVRNRKLRGLILSPELTETEEEILLDLYPNLPSSVQLIIDANCRDNGAGTGIHERVEY